MRRTKDCSTTRVMRREEENDVIHQLRSLALNAHRGHLGLAAHAAHFLLVAVADAARHDFESDDDVRVLDLLAVVVDLEVEVVVQRVAHHGAVAVVDERAADGEAVAVVGGVLRGDDAHDAGEVVHQDLGKILVGNEVNELLHLLLVVVHFAHDVAYSSHKTGIAHRPSSSARSRQTPSSRCGSP